MGGYAGLINSIFDLRAVANLGCNPTDYAGLPAKAVLLVKRGVCTFREKTDLAAAALASAILIYNDGTSPQREGIFGGDVGENSSIPTFSMTYLLGSTLADLPNITVSLYVNAIAQFVTTRNIIADTIDGDPNNIIVVGSHLDSVPPGPGINDNGSGSSLNLELALQLFNTKFPTRNKIRFAWWGAEELGLLGSEFYVAHLSAAERNQIALNLNFDMLGSPNFIYGIYNGSGAAANISQASVTIQDVFISYFTQNSLPFDLTPFSGRSDYGPFIANNIPAGGLFTGADEMKSVEQRSKYGGLVNVPLDPCYHQSCDTVENIDQEALSTMSQAAVFTLGTLALQENLRNYLIS